MRESTASQTISVRIRNTATEAFVVPAREAGRTRLSIAVRELMDRFPREFAHNRQSVFCSALKAKAFLQPNGLSIEKMDGPEQKRGTSVVYHYRLEQGTPSTHRGPMSKTEAAIRTEELLAPLRGLLKDEIGAFGGTEALMRWVRSDEPTA